MDLRPGLALATLLLPLTGCGDASDRAVDRGSAPAVDELAAHGGEPCPDVLADPNDDHGFGTETSAERAPALAAQDAAWVCLYSATDSPAKESGQGAYFDWTLASEATPVAATDLSDLQAALDGLAPTEKIRACTAELGPRVMFVTAKDGDLTGVVVDIYGCSDVRLTDDPYANPPGIATQPGTVSGVLTSTALAELARAEAGLAG